MSKRNDESAEQPPNEWPIGEVIATARVLYALRPFPLDEKPDPKWNLLARQAFDFLDNARRACERVAQQRRRRKVDAIEHYIRKGLRRVMNLPLSEDGNVSFDHALRFSMDQRTTKLAEKKFEALAPWLPDCFHVTKRELPTLIIRWRTEGITFDEMMKLQQLYDNAVDKREAKRTKKRRRKWPDERREKTAKKTPAWRALEESAENL
jgi:hypothetical protein